MTRKQQADARHGITQERLMRVQGFLCRHPLTDGDPLNGRVTERVGLRLEMAGEGRRQGRADACRGNAAGIMIRVLCGLK